MQGLTTAQRSIAVVIQDFPDGRGPMRIGGYFLHWRNQKFRVFSNSKIYKKMLKNQWKIYNSEKIFNFTYKNLNGKLIFYPFSHIFQAFCHFIHLWNIPGVLVKWQVLGLRIARSRVQVRPGSWSGRLSLPLWKGRKVNTSHLGRNLRFTAWIIAKSHAMCTQGGTQVPCSDHLVRALLGCQTREIVPISWLIFSDFNAHFGALLQFSRFFV